MVAQNLTQLTRDELKSVANEDLTLVVAQLREDFDSNFQGRWLTPLMVIRNGIDSAELGVAQKMSAHAWLAGTSRSRGPSAQRLGCATAHCRGE